MTEWQRSASLYATSAHNGAVKSFATSCHVNLPCWMERNCRGVRAEVWQGVAGAQGCEGRSNHPESLPPSPLPRPEPSGVQAEAEADATASTSGQVSVSAKNH